MFAQEREKRTFCGPFGCAVFAFGLSSGRQTPRPAERRNGERVRTRSRFDDLSRAVRRELDATFAQRCAHKRRRIIWRLRGSRPALGVESVYLLKKFIYVFHFVNKILIPHGDLFLLFNSPGFRLRSRFVSRSRSKFSLPSARARARNVNMKR